MTIKQIIWGVFFFTVVSISFYQGVFAEEGSIGQEKAPAVSTDVLQRDNYINKIPKISGKIFQPLMIGGKLMGNPLFTKNLIKEIKPISPLAAVQIKKATRLNWAAFISLSSVPVLVLLANLVNNKIIVTARKDDKQYRVVEGTSDLYNNLVPIGGTLAVSGMIELYLGMKMYLESLKYYDEELKEHFKLDK